MKNWKCNLLVTASIIGIIGTSVIIQNVNAGKIIGTVGNNITTAPVEMSDRSITLKKEVNFLSKEINTEYVKSLVNDDGIKSDVYQDKDKNEYIYENEKLVGFLRSNIEKDSVDSISAISNQTINFGKIANDFFQKLAGDRAQEYVFDKSTYVESYDEYTYVYTKMINSYKTNDTIFMSFNSNGTLMSFSIDREGLFDSLTPSIDEKEVFDLIETEIYNKYKTKDYKLENQVIDYINGNYVLSNYIKINVDNYVTSDIVYYFI